MRCRAHVIKGLSVAPSSISRAPTSVTHASILFSSAVDYLRGFSGHLALRSTFCALFSSCFCEGVMLTNIYKSKMINEQMDNLHNNINFRIQQKENRNYLFLARKIHKFKKMLKLRSKSLSQPETPSANFECQQNHLNERLEYKFTTTACCECEQNTINENKQNSNTYDQKDYTSSIFCGWPEKLNIQPICNSTSICYVFMPGQAQPVSVKLKTNRINGGVMWVSYRPDFDIQTSSYYSSYQKPEPQKSILV